MKIIKIYYDHERDELALNRRGRNITADPVVEVNVPEETRVDKGCVFLPDHLNAVFKNRRVTPLELMIRAVVLGHEVNIASTNYHGFHTFSIRGAPEPKKSAKK